MKINSRIEIEFSGITLPVVRDANEREVVPLKPISDVFGLKWEKQREKFASIDDTCTPPKGGAGSENPPISDISGGAIPPAASAISRRFGACLAMVPFAGQSREMLCIRLDRVEAFINQIDPDRVRGNGNETGADFLEAKQSEWDDVLAAAFARLLLFTDPAKLPKLGDADGAWQLYLRTWRPGKPHPHTWPDLYAQALEATD